MNKKKIFHIKIKLSCVALNRILPEFVHAQGLIVTYSK